MNARDELAKVIESGYGDDLTDCPYDHAPTIADVVLAAGYSKPRTITTTEEVDALPNGSVVLDHTGDVLKRSTHRVWLSTDEEDATYVVLPATVLHEAGAK